MEKRDLAVIVALVVLTAVAFAPVLDASFVGFDDNVYVYENPRVMGGPNAENILWALTSFHAANWHPLTWVSHMVDTRLFGTDPRGHHAVNLLLHAANAVALFLLLAAATGAHWRSAFAAALFAVHPLHVEPVAWVSERKELLSMLLGLLATGAYLRALRRHGTGATLVAACLFALSLMAKPMLVTLPFLLLLLDVWPLGRLLGPRGDGRAGARASLGRLVVEKAPLLLLTGLSGAMTWRAQSASSAVESLEFLPFSLRAMNALESYALYVVKAMWPSDLAVLYPHPGFTIAAWEAAFAGAGLAAVTAAALLATCRRPYLIVGWLWFLGTLFPVIGLVQVGFQARADRYTYLPLTGIFVIAVWGAAEACRSARAKRLAAALGAVAVLALSALTRVQAGTWQSSVKLFSHAVEATDENGLMHHSLAVALTAEGRAAEALPHFQAAGRIKPYYANRRGPGWADLPVWRYTAQTPERVARSKREMLR